MLAVEAPVKKLVVVAGAALAIAAFVHRPHAADRTYHHRLTLHAPVEANAFYLTVFANGRVQHSDCDTQPLEVDMETAELPPLTFTTRAHVYDGCEWRATERLVPNGDHSYAYSYQEEILSCRPGAHPTRATPRTGTVTVDR